MATYVIGDVHGQLAALGRLLERLPFDDAKDQLWLTGDLVNRGPDSLGVLRWARRAEERLGDRFVVVLGNHDLHFIARAWGLAEAKRRDRLDLLLQAPDVAELARWLIRRPLLYRSDAALLVHAGLRPSWTAAQAVALARRTEALLRDDRCLSLVAAAYGSSATAAALPTTVVDALSVMTRIRGLRTDGTIDPFKGPPHEARRGSQPWFRLRRRSAAEPVVLFGHWAALGLHLSESAVCLDSGAGWNQQLTALRLGDRQLFQVDIDASGDGH